MESKKIFKLMNKKGIAMITAVTIALTTFGAGSAAVYADEVGTKTTIEAVQENTKDFNDGAYFQNKNGYSIQSISAEDTAVKAYNYNFSKVLSDKSTVCLKGNSLVKFDTKGNVVWEKQLDSQVCYSTPTYNNLLVDREDNIIVLGYYSGKTDGIYAVYDVNGNRIDYKYGSSVPVPYFADSVTFDFDENLLYQRSNDVNLSEASAANIYYVYDRSTYKYAAGDLIEYNYYGYYHNNSITTTNDGGRAILGYATASTRWSESDRDTWHYPWFMKVNSNNKVVYCKLYTDFGVPGSQLNRRGFYPNVYKTADGGMIVRVKSNGKYYKVDSVTGLLTEIKTCGTVLGFKSVNGVDYVYGKISKGSLGYIASDIVTSTVDYVVPVGEDMTEGIYFNSNFGAIKDLTSDSDGNLQVLFSCKNNEIIDNLVDEGKVVPKIISVTLNK